MLPVLPCPHLCRHGLLSAEGLLHGGWVTDLLAHGTNTKLRDCPQVPSQAHESHSQLAR